MIFFTSDTHFNHEGILKFTSRGELWNDVHEMTEGIVERWNSVVGPDDFTWILGDYDMNGKPESLAILPRLNGRKGLVVGNHEKCFYGMSKSNDNFVASFKMYMDAGFEIVTQFAKVKIPAPTKNTKGTWFMMSHFPYDGDGEREEQSGEGDRYIRERLKDFGQPILHGHTHIESQRINYSRHGTFQLHVGMDAWDYTPISEIQVSELYYREVGRG